MVLWRADPLPQARIRQDVMGLMELHFKDIPDLTERLKRLHNDPVDFGGNASVYKCKLSSKDVDGGETVVCAHLRDPMLR